MWGGWGHGLPTTEWGNDDYADRLSQQQLLMDVGFRKILAVSQHSMVMSGGVSQYEVCDNIDKTQLSLSVLLACCGQLATCVCPIPIP